MTDPINIPWVKVGDRIPTNADILGYSDGESTPYVPCLVWSCNPNYIHGGVMETVRWDRDLNRWRYEDTYRWTLQPPYVITHFIELERLSIPNP